MSPVRSVVSGIGSSDCGRQRSATWHGAVVQTNEVQDETNASSAYLTISGTRTVPTLKDAFQEIITQELHDRLGGDCGLKCSQEFIDESAVISRAIAKKARQMIDCSKTKVISSVFIGEVRDDGIEVTSQCLFDPAQDAFASGNFKSSSIFAVGTLFVVTYLV